MHEIGKLSRIILSTKISLNYESGMVYSSLTYGPALLSCIWGSEQVKEGFTAFKEEIKPNFRAFRK